MPSGRCRTIAQFLVSLWLPLHRLCRSRECHWVLRSDPRRRGIGFVRSADLRPRERWTLSDDE